MLLSDFLLQRCDAEPQRDAVVCGVERWSYARLATEVARFRAELSSLGVARGDRVVVRAEAEPAAIAAQIAIMSLGAAYVPLAPELPAARFEAILAKVEPAVIVTGDSSGAGGGAQTARLGTLTATRTGVASVHSSGPPAPEDPAYIIMTSGSTGQPKGIVMSHGAAVASLRGFCDLGIAPSTRIGSISPLHFDFAVFDVGMSLGNGATLILVPRMLAFHPRGFAMYLSEHRVTQMHSVPSVWQLILAEDDPAVTAGLQQLETVLYAAESFAPADVRRLQSKVPGLQVHQCFGHSESIGCCFKKLGNPVETYQDRLSIGVALRGTEMFALDESGREIEPGQVGELYVRGPHLFLGYFRDEEQTRRRLVPDPRTGQGIVFRSGDLVTRDERGEFYFIGRVDHQVKVAGNRVELSEIDHVVRGDADVLNAVTVVAADDGRKTLACFVVSRGATPWPELATRLRTRLSAALPRYMVPRYLHRLDSIPLLSNGKIDRVQLGQMAAEARRAQPGDAPRRNSPEGVAE
ncbi:hypothetical protein BE20_36940 [Sorangium cellulosum]|uniref:AMP-dependent synthetase/ligase domain-containing protein n=1 Tax=Sorangium cellulosum TaxID=56 RepID=A0A150T0B7_SORCE|nr:hypothetical protein BE18_04610 [Sorangium cellulosum]KYF97897.1 hypothetical protein BE20_36940 [Sorangium cellulosum]